MPAAKMPPCPQCRHANAVVEHGHKNHFCKTCRVEFNHDPEFDKAFHRDPAVHAEREDDYQARRRQRLGGRR